MTNHKILWLTLVSAVITILLWSLPLSVPAQVNTNIQVDDALQLFLDLCLQYEMLSEDDQATLDYLLDNADTEDCNLASQRLPRLQYLTQRLNSPLTDGTDFELFSILSEAVEITLRLRQDELSNLNFEPFSRLPKLTTLNVRGSIHDLTPFSVLENLDYLSINYNYPSNYPQIQTLAPLSNLTGLTALHLTNASRQGIVSDVNSLSNLTALRELSIVNQYISDLTPIANLTQLNRLGLTANPIEDLSPLQSLTQLNHLSISRTEVSDLTPLSGHESLTSISANSANISDITPLQSIQNLKGISMFDNQIADITPLASLSQLEALSLSENNITDLSALSNLTQLRSLSISGNPVTDLSPLSNLTNLEFVELPNDPDLDLSPLDALPQRERLHIRQGGCGRC